MNCAKAYRFVFLQLLSGSALAAPFSISITVDENCNGLLTNTNGFSGSLPCGFQTDLGPGDLAGVMTYSLRNPPGLTAGDVFLQDAIGGPILDVVRFNSAQTCVDASVGCLVFYSDNVPTFDSGADTSAPPGSFYTNTVTIAELGTDGNNGAVYTPTSGQPGFVTGAAGPVTYTLISDAVSVPEPGSLILVGTGLIVGARRWRKRKANT